MIEAIEKYFPNLVGVPDEKVRYTCSGQMWDNGGLVCRSFKAFNLNHESMVAFAAGVRITIEDTAQFKVKPELTGREGVAVIKYRLNHSEHQVAELNVYAKEEV